MAGKSHDRIDRASLIGMRSGKRIIIAVLPYDRTKNLPIPVMVRCDCGHEMQTNFGLFRRTQSCKRCTDRSMVTTHGRSSERLYAIWNGMKHRCGPNASPKVKPYYYDKGIRVCDEWQDYEVFRAWALSHGYKPGLSIDRISPDMNYAPHNCEWVSLTENFSRKHTDHLNYSIADLIQHT